MIPFSPPVLSDDDINAVVGVLRSGWITTGPVSREFEKELTAYCDAGGTVLLNSATAGLEMALRLAEVGPGDEVIVPAYTYTASASVVDHVGARVVLVDTAQDMCVPDIDTILDAVTDRTAAIITVDIAGIPFPLETLRVALEGRGCRRATLAAALNRPVLISDAAHSLGGVRNGKYTGAIADLTAFSFHAVKNLTTAEGGALQWHPHLPTDQVELERQIRLLSLHGQSKDALAKTVGSAWEYDIEELAWKCNMPDILAALGLSQLKRYEQIIERRLEILRFFTEELVDTGITLLQHEGEGYRSSGHLAVTRLPFGGESARNAFIDGMRQRGVATNVHYKPLPLLTAYRARGFSHDNFPNAMDFYRSEVTLPLHMALSDDDVKTVVHAVRESLTHLGI